MDHDAGAKLEPMSNNGGDHKHQPSMNAFGQGEAFDRAEEKDNFSSQRDSKSSEMKGRGGGSKQDDNVQVMQF
jgi:hypothetical protein